jgi:hypothetical protein
LADLHGHVRRDVLVEPRVVLLLGFPQSDTQRPFASTYAVSLATIDVLEGASRDLHREEASCDHYFEEEALRRLGVGR